MNKEVAAIGTEELRLLATLVGAHWTCVAGEHLTEQLFSPLQVIVQTSNGGVAIASEIFDSDFEGAGLDSYSRLRVTNDLGSLPGARQTGKVFFQHSGERIEDIHVVRDVITEVVAGIPKWCLTSDVGITFQLSTGEVAVAKSSLHTELLQVTFAATTADLAIPDLSIEWEDDLSRVHLTERRVQPLKDLLRTP